MNTFKERKEEPVIEKASPKPPNQPRQSPKIKEKPPRTSQPVQGKRIRKGIKAVSKGFESVFGGGFLQKINIRENWKFISFLVLLLIILINSNLKIQSQRNQIEKLKQKITLAKDEAMDAVEEGFTIDKQKEKEILKEGEERGFYNNGYLPYIIDVKEKSKKQ